MSVIWLKLWQHVWQSLKPLVKGFGSSPTEFKVEIWRTKYLNSWYVYSLACLRHWNKRFGGLKNAVLSQRIGYNSAGCRTSVRDDCALPILPCSKPGCEGIAWKNKRPNIALAVGRFWIRAAETPVNWPMKFIKGWKDKMKSSHRNSKSGIKFNSKIHTFLGAIRTWKIRP